ncbi:3-phosphoshikimate 1-carboxyvinyltransferase [Dokdonia sp. Hel_I_53]|uniref:3-phosphoshikimate 1-carboxyvinyltransferase n=1 Tax=Dokdonia sp. Hel_I_53 TaxID=1566287 RepID=UPI001199056E|nr:3-phosphoshikimate 1-carboxyvinyltransferase [Dokdonia sp. Hel_I_53]TVZ53203.1 3-phosphoshikimate 1-carboxyvinyltransferase [Dokdonia sp. Hel_I_53]
MLLKIHHPNTHCEGSIQITGSKSETNRLLILQALFEGISLKNVSNSDDAKVMQQALLSDQKEIDIHHAGTAMRFLTAYFSIQKGRETLLTGSSRMQERPIEILVDAVRQLGAIIRYTKKEGFPPIQIHGKNLTKDTITLKADVSSQYISALMMMGAKLESGLTIHLVGKITSIPYIYMTLALLRQIDVEATFKDQTIVISSGRKTKVDRKVVVESDWSSASYFYSIIALSRKRISNPSIILGSYRENSLQGDAVLQEIYKKLGVSSIFKDDKLQLKLIRDFELPKTITLDLVRCPDIAQTIAVTCLGLGVGCHLTGLHTLKIKETDRLEALKEEITKLGGAIMVTEKDLTLLPQKAPLNENITIATYHDHRMAMSFAPLGLQIPMLIEDARVVSKSYPDYWNDLKSLGFVQEIIG